MRLCAVKPALAPHAAGANGGHRLQDMVARAQRVFSRVEQGQHTGTLVVVHTVLPQQRQ